MSDLVEEAQAKLHESQALLAEMETIDVHNNRSEAAEAFRQGCEALRDAIALLQKAVDDAG